MQDAFLAVWRGAARYASGRGSVRNWMLSILHNRGVDRLRTLGAMSRRQDALEQVELRRPDEPDAADVARPRHGRAGPRGAARACPSEQLEVLRLAYYGGLHPPRDRPDARACRSGPSRAGCGSAWSACAAGSARRRSATRMTTEHDALRDLLAPVALGAAEPAEIARVEAHAAGCAICREELEALRAGAAVLAVDVPQHEPPPGLRDSMMSIVRAEAAERAEREEPAARPAPARPAPRGRRRLLGAAVPGRRSPGRAVAALLAARGASPSC